MYRNTPPTRGRRNDRKIFLMVESCQRLTPLFRGTWNEGNDFQVYKWPKIGRRASYVRNVFVHNEDLSMLYNVNVQHASSNASLQIVLFWRRHKRRPFVDHLLQGSYLVKRLPTSRLFFFGGDTCILTVSLLDWLAYFVGQTADDHLSKCKFLWISRFPPFLTDCIQHVSLSLVDSLCRRRCCLDDSRRHHNRGIIRRQRPFPCSSSVEYSTFGWMFNFGWCVHRLCRSTWDGNNGRYWSLFDVHRWQSSHLSIFRHYFVWQLSNHLLSSHWW